MNNRPTKGERSIFRWLCWNRVNELQCKITLRLAMDDNNENAFSNNLSFHEKLGENLPAQNLFWLVFSIESFGCILIWQQIIFVFFRHFHRSYSWFQMDSVSTMTAYRVYACSMRFFNCHWFYSLPLETLPFFIVRCTLSIVFL